MKNKKEDRSSYAIGGATLIGVGIGIAFLIKSVLFFAAAILVGIGVGLLIASLISNK